MNYWLIVCELHGCIAVKIRKLFYSSFNCVFFFLILFLSWQLIKVWPLQQIIMLWLRNDHRNNYHLELIFYITYVYNVFIHIVSTIRLVILCRIDLVTFAGDPFADPVAQWHTQETWVACMLAPSDHVWAGYLIRVVLFSWDVEAEVESETVSPKTELPSSTVEEE